MEQHYDHEDSSDDDYAPSDSNHGSDEELSGDDEDVALLHEDNKEYEKKNGNSKKLNNKRNNNSRDVDFSRKRRGGISLEGEIPCETESDQNVDLANQISEDERLKKETLEKKKADDLWSSFLSDIPSKTPKLPKKNISTASSSKPLNHLNPTKIPVEDKAQKKSIKEFQFAGEKFNIEVLQKKESSAAESGTVTKQKGGLSNVLGKISSKNKIGTLEKSRLDWNKFKTDEGIDEELSSFNRGKSGYLEKKDFLERTDLRQFEIEREIRQKNSKKIL